MSRICRQCNIEFIPVAKNNFYCPPHRVEWLNCKICGILFVQQRNKLQKICTKECKESVIGITYLKSSTCKLCNKTFKYNFKDRTGTFCSRECSFKEKLVTKDILKEYMTKMYNQKVMKKEGCWSWAGSVRRKYGLISMGSNSDILIHRASWEIHNGPIPKGLCVLHKCDNPICSNPEHLFLGTQLDNIQDMFVKQRNRKTINKEIAKEIKLMLSQKISCKEIAEKLNVSKGLVWNISRGTTWKHVKLEEE